MFHISFETSGLLPTRRTAGYDQLRVEPRSRGVACYWHLLEAELRERGHEAVAVDLPAADDSAGLSEYADAVVGAIGDRTDLVLVVQYRSRLSSTRRCRGMGEPRRTDIMADLASTTKGGST